MGVNVLKCFPWYNRRKERSKMAKSPSLEGPGSTMETIHQSKPTAGGHSPGNCAYFSEKARVSFRHELNSPAFAIDSTN